MIKQVDDEKREGGTSGGTDNSVKQKSEPKRKAVGVLIVVIAIGILFAVFG